MDIGERDIGEKGHCRSGALEKRDIGEKGHWRSGAFGEKDRKQAQESNGEHKQKL